MLGFSRFSVERLGFTSRFYSTSLSHVFSAENKASFCQHIEKLKPFQRGLEKAEKKASVLVPLVNINGTPSLLYTVRKSTLNKHAGEVCFPGGKFDKDLDKDLLDSALRETEEELGINRDLFEVWGSLPPLSSRDGATAVTAVVALLKGPLPEMKLSPGEVEEVFTRSIPEFCARENFGYTQFRAGYTLPVYFAHYSSPQPKIWGLTAVVTHQVLSALTPDTYKLKLKFATPFLLKNKTQR